MNKKAQFNSPIVWFFIVVFGLLLFAPITLKVFNSINTPIQNNLGYISGAAGTLAKQNFAAVMTPLVTFWDKVIIAAFAISIILLFISAFMIDTNPFWIILYIIINFVLILFAPSIIDSLASIYDSATFAVETNSLVFLDTLRTYFAEFLVGIMFVTGIIIYGKIWLLRSLGGRQ